MKPPIIVRSEGDLEFFESPEAAAWGPEEIDIEDGLYSLWDSEGRRLKVVEQQQPRRFLPGLKTRHTIVVEEVEREPVNPDELRAVILSYLGEQMPRLVERNLKAALAFVGNLHKAYEEADARLRRQMNQALFVRILVSDEGEVARQLRPPFELLLEATGTTDDGLIQHRRGVEAARGPHYGPRGLNKQALVELAGLEPATSWVRSRRSPS